MLEDGLGSFSIKNSGQNQSLLPVCNTFPLAALQQQREPAAREDSVDDKRAESIDTAVAEQLAPSPTLTLFQTLNWGLKLEEDIADRLKCARSSAIQAAGSAARVVLDNAAR
jgi:hypothetical protein